MTLFSFASICSHLTDEPCFPPVVLWLMNESAYAGIRLPLEGSGNLWQMWWALSSGGKRILALGLRIGKLMPLQWKICLCGLPPRAGSPPYLQVSLHRRFQEARAKYFLSFIMTISVKVLEAVEKEGQNSTAVGSLESSFKEQSHSSCSWCRKNDEGKEQWIQYTN